MLRTLVLNGIGFLFIFFTSVQSFPIIKEVPFSNKEKTAKEAILAIVTNPKLFFLLFTGCLFLCFLKRIINSSKKN